MGYVGNRPCEELLLAGLERLEYRGYDSAGISLEVEGRLERVRSTDSLAGLRRALARRADQGTVMTATEQATTGIGHTRWATHGAVTEENSHPHCDDQERVHLVLNGIVENHLRLRADLESQGAVFSSDTDAEVVAHLVAHHYQGDLVTAVSEACEGLRGHYAFVVASVDEPGRLVAVRRECPLVVGVGAQELFVASAASAFLRETRRIQVVEDGEVVALTAERSRFFDSAGTERRRAMHSVLWKDEGGDRQGFQSFMLKEINEQPAAIEATIDERIERGRVSIPQLRTDGHDPRELERISLLGCGTSYNAALIGRCAIEHLARLPVAVDIASEYRYRQPTLNPSDLVIGITQSGETADTLAAMRLARAEGARVLAITNVEGSQATRDSDGAILTRAGTEVGVAATKTFVSQVALMYLLALDLAQARGTGTPDEIELLVEQLIALPETVGELIESIDERVREIADRFTGAPFFLYLGRHVGLPVALEGALKLKEVSYVPTDVYAAGEMKHGPIALLDEGTPVVCIATDSPVLGKMLSNMSEVRARGASVIAVATEGSKQVAEHAQEVVYVPPTHWLLAPLLSIIPLQLLAYRIARNRGLDVDRPRNLAKTVTVE